MAYAGVMHNTGANGRTLMQHHSDDDGGDRAEDHDLALEHHIEAESKMLHEGGSSSAHSTTSGRVEGRTFHSSASSALHRSTPVG